MSYYIRILNGPRQVWWLADDEAYQVGVGDPKQRPGAYFRADPGETIQNALLRQASGFFGPNGEWPFHFVKRAPGEFYPRILRPLDRDPTYSLGWSVSAKLEPDVVATARGQLSALTRQLGRICQTVHPRGRGLDTFGHDIRNLLILACTEVETHWRGVLIANGASRAGGRTTTSDYVKLNDAMRLDQFAVEFPSYPWLARFRPFDGWGSTNKPTQELAWYDTYNAAKHDRETAFERATLERVFEAISACVVMVVAQFGAEAGLGVRSELSSYFHLVETPEWPYEDLYIYPYGTDPPHWRPINYAF
jgi:hypothetical protein